VRSLDGSANPIVHGSLTLTLVQLLQHLICEATQRSFVQPTTHASKAEHVTFVFRFAPNADQLAFLVVFD